MTTTTDTRTTSEQAAAQLREVADYLSNNAEAIVGDIDSIYVLEGGLRISFTLLENQSIPTLEVSKECIVYERQQS